MENFFLFLFGYFKSRRVLFFVIVAAILLIAALVASRISFEEDIAKMISGVDRKTEITTIFNRSKFLDKIIVNISLSDTSAPPAPEKLILYGKKLHDTLLTGDFPQYLSDVTFRIPDDIMEDVMAIVYRNLPLFLEEEDYKTLDSLIAPQRIREALENSYNSLLTPASFAMKKNILMDPAGLTGIVTRKLRAYQNDISYLIIDGSIFSRDKKSLLMFLTTTYSSNVTSKTSKLVKSLDNVINQISKEAGNEVRIEYFGSAAVAAGNADRLKRDISLTISITIILLVLIIAFSIKKKALIPFIFLPAVFGGLTALAVIYLIQAKISIIALSIGTVILAITVDYALHITAHYKHKHSVAETIRDVSFPIIVCGFTTAFEFMSLVFVSSESLHELGILAAISVITAAFFTMIVMPQILDVTRREDDETEEKNYLERILDKLTNYEFDKNKRLLLFMVIATVVCWFYLDKVGLESDMMKMNYMSKKLAMAEENLNRINNYKLNSVYVIAHGKDLQEALENNEKLMSEGKTLMAQNRIKTFNSPGALLSSDSLQEKRIERWNLFWDKSKKDSFLKNFRHYSARTGFRQEAFEEFYNLLDRKYTPMDPADFRKLADHFYSENITYATGLTAIVSVMKTDALNKDFVEEEMGKVDGVVVIDRKSILSEVVRVLGKDFDFIANLSLSIILVIMIIAFGRFELGFITFIPILVSWVWTLGFMGITGIKFNIFNIIISQFITGLGIDYSIYIMQGLVQGYKTGTRNLLSYKTCILLSVLISISGTGVLILAKHPALKSIALISIVGLLSVVLISYTFEIVVFNWLVRKNGKNRYLPLTISEVLLTVATLAAGLVLCVFLNILLIPVLLAPVSGKKKKRFMHHALMWCIRLPVYGLTGIRKTILNPENADFSRPSLIISNHQSHLDLPLLLMLNPNIIILTNNWVWNNPLYALVIRYLHFYPVTWGYENLIEKLKKEVGEGYSILVFPEGTRSPDSGILRFHKGAFLMAEKLGLDVTPIIIHGAGDCMRKGENHLRKGSITMKIYPRVAARDPDLGNDYHQRTRAFLRFYRDEYKLLRKELETPSYFRGRLVSNYIYKGPVLEWYTRVKLKLEKNYEYINSLVPEGATIVDIGCGYGMISYMLGFISENRKILGIDYDENKIELAINCISKNDRISFVAADAVTFDYPDADIFLLSDVLHYIPREKQAGLLASCIRRLKPGGKIIIRDADSDLQKRHVGTRFTEFFSTTFGYNKSLDRKLFFFSGRFISELATGYNMQLEVVDNSRLTSNKLFVLSR